MSLWWTSDRQRQNALFEHGYRLYQEEIAGGGQTPASREVILEEVKRKSEYTPLSLLAHKRLRRVP